MPGTYEPIATNTLTSTASNITFSSIPGTYTDIRLILCGRNAPGSLNNYFALTFNNDTGGNYSETYILGYGSDPAYSSGTTGGSWIALGGVNGIDETQPALLTADIFSYAGSTAKTVLSNRYVERNNTSGDVGVSVGLWNNTSAITSIRINNSGGSFAIGTIATLYGIKNA